MDIRFLVAVSAAVDIVLFINATEHLRKLLLRGSNATRICTGDLRRDLAGAYRVGLIRFGKKLQNERHTDISAVFRLLEVASAGIIVNLDGDLVYTGQRVHDAEIGLRVFELVERQNVAVLQTEIFIVACEAFLLNNPWSSPNQ